MKKLGFSVLKESRQLRRVRALQNIFPSGKVILQFLTTASKSGCRIEFEVIVLQSKTIRNDKSYVKQ
jgi:hypothetical protein